MSYITPLPDEAFARNFASGPRPLVILGSTGSIGTSALKVLEQTPDRFRILGLAGATNVELLARQADRWRPPFLAVIDEARAEALQQLLPKGYLPEILVGPEGYETMASLEAVEIVLAAQVGAAGLRPTLAAAQAGKVIALANKEALVLAGDLMRRVCRDSGAVILPVDSEHNAVFQALAGHDHKEVRRILLTASGGPFRERDAAFLQGVTPQQALAHPTWDMGAKISIDSATLMNKGLEVIEAFHLFGEPLEKIEVVVHPQSVIHSMVDYVDGSILAHLGRTDMQIPIAFCLSWPERLPLSLEPLDFARLGSLTFEKPDTCRFPCLALAMEALRRGPGYPVILNAANEVAVDFFLRGIIGFLDIPKCIARSLDTPLGSGLDEKLGRGGNGGPENVDDIIAIDHAARERAAIWAADGTL